MLIKRMNFQECCCDTPGIKKVSERITNGPKTRFVSFMEVADLIRGK